MRRKSAPGKVYRSAQTGKEQDNGGQDAAVHTGRDVVGNCGLLLHLRNLLPEIPDLVLQ